MTDVNDMFEARDNAADEHKRRLPAGEAPTIDAPDPLLFNELRGHHTDKSLANTFFRRYRHMFCNGDGQLYLYLPSSAKWVRTDIATHVYTMVMQLSASFYEELAIVTGERAIALDGGNNELAEKLAIKQQSITKLILHTEKAATIGNVAKMVQSLLRTVLESERVRMNPDPALLSCKNGIVDLRTGELRWAQPEDRITLNTGIDYVPNADTNWWHERVLQMCSGNARMAEYLQVWFGYCATGYTREHCMAVLYGSGRNGKNILMDAVSAALGGYANALTASFLEAQGAINSDGNNQLYMMAQLDGVRMAYVSETGERGKMKESVVKSLTGDKKVRARLAYQDFYEFEVSHKFTVGTNHKPEISGTDDGVWERIRLVPMRVKFGDQEEIDAGVAQYLKDTGLLDEVMKVSKREEVLNWIVQGSTKYLKLGLRQYTPPEVAAETKAYRREQDTLGQFLQSVSVHVPLEEIDRTVARLAALAGPALGRVSIDDRLMVEKSELWRVYSVWARDNGHGVMSSTMFSRRITSAQRFWPGDGTGELVMRPLEGARTNVGAVYQFYKWSSIGLQFREHARREQRSEVRTDEH